MFAVGGVFVAYWLRIGGFCCQKEVRLAVRKAPSTNDRLF
jgi:hypothetical protein